MENFARSRNQSDCWICWIPIAYAMRRNDNKRIQNTFVRDGVVLFVSLIPSRYWENGWYPQTFITWRHRNFNEQLCCFLGLSNSFATFVRREQYFAITIFYEYNEKRTRQSRSWSHLIFMELTFVVNSSISYQNWRKQPKHVITFRIEQPQLLNFLVTFKD